MTWREQVARLEREGNFDIAVFLLEKVIKDNPNEVDAYILLLYRLMDSCLENACYWSNALGDPLRDIKSEYYENKNQQDYRHKSQKYFDASYARFGSNPEYLYYASKLLLHAHDFMFLNTTDDMLLAMREQAISTGYNSLIEQGYPQKADDIAWAMHILSDASIQAQLATKGAAAEYVIGDMVLAAKRIVENAAK